MLISKTPDTREKLTILSRDSCYDLACSCATRKDEHRRRSADGKWVYPVVLPNGGTTFLFKTLLSNKCVNDCKYCPLRANSQANRCSLTSEELAKTFLSYYRARRVSGLFLSSGVDKNPAAAMENINRSAAILRRSGFRGYIHLKIVPSAPQEAIRLSLSLATAVSLNIENAKEENFRQLSVSKNYAKGILEPMRLISKLTAKGSVYPGVKQTTQFIVGASSETDKDIVDCSWKLYKETGLARVYFSAYQQAAASGDNNVSLAGDLLTREHRLYQVDWLIRKYGFNSREIPFGADGNLSLNCDPKEAWAKLHPEFFPVNINKDDKSRLLRVPGLGHVTVEKIINFRRLGRIGSLEAITKSRAIIKKVSEYLIF